MASEIRSNAAKMIKNPLVTGGMFGGFFGATFGSSLGKALRPVANPESKDCSRDEEKKDLPSMAPSVLAAYEEKSAGFFGRTMDTLNKLVEERNEYKPCHGCGPKS